MLLPGRRTAITMLVASGLALSVVGGVIAAGSPQTSPPGIALGSEIVLTVERIAVLFAAWLMVLVVVARALAGELPAEVSGRGLRYAEIATSERDLVVSGQAIRRLEVEIETLNKAIVDLDAASAKPSKASCR